MRAGLAQLLGQRLRFEAVVQRTGVFAIQARSRGQTLCVGQVRRLGQAEVLADHVWLTYTRTMQRLAPLPGETVAFDAMVSLYAKGFVSRRLGVDDRAQDYFLTDVRQFIVKRA